MHAKETKSRTYMQWSAEPAEASMERKDQQQATRSWTTRRDEKKRRMGLVSSWVSGPLLPREKLVDSLEDSLRRRIGSCSKGTTRSRLIFAPWSRSILRNCMTCI